MQSTGILRPTFTEDLATQLGQGACIKLVSPHGQGRRRTLADLRLCLPDSVRILQANLRHYPQSLAAMLDDLAVQAGLADAGCGWEGMLEALQQRPGRTLIILHNLDEMEAGEASGYDDGFFAALNGICDRARLSLLCVLEHGHGPSPLRLGTLKLPALTEGEILTELARRHPSAANPAWPMIARWIATRPDPYTLLGRPETWPNQA